MSVEKLLSDDGNALTIVMDQKFDFSKVQDFRMAYSDVGDGLKEVTVDLKDTDYMDSSALGMLLNMQKTLSDRVSTFKIAHCKPQVMKILKISRFDKKFDIS
ncbi:STAS domain-containing protein [Aestuariibacter salexigens]|uniref:STAS domain-containing protein n=1 Tax=Aestuariibacter salexigens TaxID=226010 RepID=UPI000419E49A|nr:STAS domain-containing protein [Aestuariibacter salexigens]